METITFEQAEQIIDLLNQIHSTMTTFISSDELMGIYKHLYVIANVAFAFTIWEVIKALHKLYNTLLR